MLQDIAQLRMNDPNQSADDAHHELLLGRELYGHLLTLGWRPMSRGNDLAVIKGWELVRTLISSLGAKKRVIFTDARLQLIQAILGEETALPVEEGARIVVGALTRLVTVPFANADYTELYDEHGWPGQDLERIVVSVGPTIGIGDELLMARALVQNLNYDGVAVEVESERPDLWTTVEPKVLSLGSPPLATHQRISQLAPEARARTMVIRADFLPSDPSPFPWYLPTGLAVTAGWTFGSATATTVDSINRCVRNIRYPIGLPESRVLESHWVAARLLEGVGSNTGRASKSEVTQYSQPLTSSKPSVFMHVLTSKPDLMLDPKFYASMLSSTRARLGWLPDIRLLAGPTPKTRAICDLVAEVVTTMLPGVKLEIVGSSKLSGIREELESSSVLFGPDTFVGHLAAMIGISQVTLQLPQHQAWINPATPTFVIPLIADFDEIVSIASQHLAFILRAANKELPSKWSEWGAIWRSHMTVVKDFVEAGVQTKPSEPTLEVMGALDRLQALKNAPPEPVIDRPDRLPYNLDLSRYVSPLDAWRAVARWYVKVATSNTSAAAYAIGSFEA